MMIKPEMSFLNMQVDGSGLQNRMIRPYHTGVRKATRNRIQWIGRRWTARAWGRALRLYIQNSAGRQAIKKMFSVSLEILSLVAYALFVGKKPEMGV